MERGERRRGLRGEGGEGRVEGGKGQEERGGEEVKSKT